MFHPDQSDTERARLLALAHDLDLVATGGSDDHGSLTGYRIGCETVSADAYQTLISRATGPRWPSRGNLAQLSRIAELTASAITPEMCGRGSPRIAQWRHCQATVRLGIVRE